MEPTPEQHQALLAFYQGIAGWLRPAIERLVPDADAVVDEARNGFEGLLGELGYVDRPTHSMASSLFWAGIVLAVHEVLRERGVDAHAWGRELHTLPALASEPDDEALAVQAREAAASQAEPVAGEFVFEMLEPDENGVRGMNIHSCAICHLFGKRDAMELVPYMCALDDVISDALGQGLRRSGTIALGASHCDFRYSGGEPRPIAEQFPDRIRLSERGDR